MATTKNTPKTKKSLSKSARNAKNSARPWTTRFSVLTVGIYTIAVTSVIVGALFASSTLMAQHNQTRLERIQAIYNSLELGDAYQVKDADVFGDKRVYNHDKSRTYSSSIEYYHADTVSNTVADLESKIKAAGFAFDNEPYPGAASTQYHYKSSKGEYIRVTVSSKVYDDALTNALIVDKNASNSKLDALDKNAAPSNVIIKVNLNDNNE